MQENRIAKMTDGEWSEVGRLSSQLSRVEPGPERDRILAELGRLGVRFRPEGMTDAEWAQICKDEGLRAVELRGPRPLPLPPGAPKNRQQRRALASQQRRAARAQAKAAKLVPSVVVTGDGG